MFPGRTTLRVLPSPRKDLRDEKVQCSGTVVKDMQDSRRFRLNCTQITGSVNSHSPPFLMERGGKNIRASSQDERLLP